MNPIISLSHDYYFIKWFQTYWLLERFYHFVCVCVRYTNSRYFFQVCFFIFSFSMEDIHNSAVMAVICSRGVHRIYARIFSDSSHWYVWQAWFWATWSEMITFFPSFSIINRWSYFGITAAMNISCWWTDFFVVVRYMAPAFGFTQITNCQSH